MNRPNHPNVHPAVVKQQYDTVNVWNFENEWRSKLCKCKPAGRCCFACFCSCCMGCKVAKYLGEPSIVGCCPCSYPYLRTKLRTARRIDGSCCGDQCVACCFCCSCASTQMANELESQGLWDPPKTRKTHPKQQHQQHQQQQQHNDQRFNQHNGGDY